MSRVLLWVVLTMALAGKASSTLWVAPDWLILDAKVLAVEAAPTPGDEAPRRWLPESRDGWVNVRVRWIAKVSAHESQRSFRTSEDLNALLGEEGWVAVPKNIAQVGRRTRIVIRPEPEYTLASKQEKWAQPRLLLRSFQYQEGAVMSWSPLAFAQPQEDCTRVTIMWTRAVAGHDKIQFAKRQLNLVLNVACTQGRAWNLSPACLTAQLNDWVGPEGEVHPTLRLESGKLELNGSATPFYLTGSLRFEVTGLRPHTPDAVQKLELILTTQSVQENL